MSEQDTQVDVTTTTSDDTTVEVVETDATADASVGTEEMVPKTQFNQVLARAKKAEEALKKIKPITKQEDAQSSQQTYTREQLNLRIDGYTDEEVEFITRNGGAKELANPNSLVAGVLKDRLTQRKAERAASQTSDSSGSSEVQVKYTVEQMNKMSLKELEAILPHA